jgi:tripartite-type tricarboxylate transporter receptor subunit TctC
MSAVASGSSDLEATMSRIWLIIPTVVGIAAAGGQSMAQDWPAKSIRAIVPFTPGSQTDIVARALFEQLAVNLGQPIVAENRTGAGGTIAAGVVAKSERDGYTVLVHSSALTIAPSLYPNMPYDTARDLAPVIPIGNSPNVLVVASSRGIKTAHDLVAAAKAKPGSFNFSSAGIGTATHLSAERFRASAGLDAVHIPFKGGPEAINEVIAGRVDFFFGPIGLVLAHIRGGNLLALAVNSPKRASALPDVPTTVEAGFADSEYPIWWGLFVPAGTPREVIAKLHKETLRTLQTPKMQERLAVLGVEPMEMTRSEFEAYVKQELHLSAALLERIGLKTN